MPRPPFFPSSAFRWAALSLGLACGGVGTEALAQGTEAPSGPILTLEQALNDLNQSPTVRQSQLSVQSAQATFNAAQASRGLTVAATGGVNYTGGYSTVLNGTPANVDSSLSGSAGVNVSVGVFPWASNQAGLRKAEWNLKYAQARLIEAQNAARLNVTQQYFNGLLATQDVKLAAQSLAVAQRALAVAQAQQANANATRQSVLSAQAGVQGAESQVTQAQASLEQARLSLGGALGRGLGNVQFVEPGGSLALPAVLPEVEPLVQRARQTRSEVISAQQQLVAAQDALAQAQVEANIPDVTASVNYGPTASSGLGASLNVQQGTASASYRQPIPNESRNSSHLSASLSGTYVLFSPTLKAQVSAAQASVAQSQVSLNVAQQSAELDVRTAYSSLQTALTAVKVQESQVQVAQAGLEAAQASLQAGTGTQDSVQSAQLSLLQAQRALLSARVNAQLALLKLTIASGGLS